MGQPTKCQFYEKQKHIFNLILYCKWTILAINFIIFLRLKKIICNKEESFLKVCFFFISSIKLMFCGLPPFSQNTGDILVWTLVKMTDTITYKLYWTFLLYHPVFNQLEFGIWGSLRVLLKITVFWDVILCRWLGLPLMLQRIIVLKI
jgi:hypothetical protein